MSKKSAGSQAHDSGPAISAMVVGRGAVRARIAGVDQSQECGAVPMDGRTAASTRASASAWIDAAAMTSDGRDHAGRRTNGSVRMADVTTIVGATMTATGAANR